MENKIKAAIHLAEGFEEIEAITTTDILRRAEIETLIVSVSGRRTVTGSHKITVICDQVFDEIDYNEYDIIILPGGMPGSKNLNSHSGLKKIIKQFYAEGKFIAAICAAPMVLGNLGLLKGKEVVCYPGFESYLPNSVISEDIVIQSDNIITAKGPGATIEFALKIIEVLKGEDISKKIRKSLMMT